MEPIGRYVPEQEVARGGMGVVLRARDPDGRQVALKLLLAGREATPMQRRRFETEVRALLKVRHPQVVSLLDAGEHRGAPYLVLEWVEGETLAARLAREGPLDPRVAAELVRRLALALEACHAQGVLHRDLSPGNVLLRADSGQPLLTDFGLAREVTRAEGELRTRTGQFLGTPGYWSPEQVRADGASVGPHTDVYGLGAVLHAALTGRAPQAGETLAEVLAALDRPARPPSALRPGLPAWLDRACLAALDPDPARRPARPRDLAALLASGAGPPEHAGGGRRWGALRLAQLLVVLALVALAFNLPWRRQEEQPRAAPVAAVTTAVSTDVAPEATVSLAAQGWLEEARVLAWRGDAAGALALLDRALERDPGWSEAWLLRGSVRLQTGLLREALRDLDQAAALAPDSPQILATRAEGRTDLGDVQGAEEDLDRALALAPDDLRANYQRARLRQRQGRRAEALRDYDRTLELGPDRVEPLIDRGSLRLDMNDTQGAGADFERALALDPRNARAWYFRAALRAKRGDPAGAVEDLARADLLDPRQERIHVAMGAALRQLGDPAGALRAAEQGLRLEPDRQLVREVRDQLAAGLPADQAAAIREAEQLVSRAIERGQGGDLRGAIELLDRAVTLDPGSARAHMSRAFARQLAGDPSGALADYDRCLTLDPLQFEARLNRAQILAQQRRFGDAIADYDRLLREVPFAPWIEKVRAARALLRP